MNYGNKAGSAYRSNPSVYSHTTAKSSATNLHSIKSRSLKSLRIPWYKRPILHNTDRIDIQKGALFTGLFSMCVAIFTICTSIFDVYCLYMAAPGSTHYGYYIISYEFVYVGSPHVRNALVIFALFSLIGGIIVLGSSMLLVVALRKEYEKKTKPWLWTYAVFISFKFLNFLFFAIVNDLIFAYNVMMVLTWLAIIAASVYGWLIVYSLFIELANLTRLEDLAHLRMGTMQSLHASTTHSLATSRPTTPHSTISTMPIGKEI